MNQTDLQVFTNANRAFTEAFGRGDFEAVASYYTEDALLMPPGLPTVVGPKAIGQFWAGGVEAMGITSLSLTTRELDVQGGTAQEIGEYELQGAQGLLDRGTYLVVWKRGPDEVWRLHWDIWNTDQVPVG